MNHFHWLLSTNAERCISLFTCDLLRQPRPVLTYNFHLQSKKRERELEKKIEEIGKDYEEVSLLLFPPNEGPVSRTLL